MSKRLLYSTVFLCFFVSGFCSLLYEVLWTRLAFAHFGIITPVLSLVVSTFMLGIGVGTAFGGRVADWSSRRLRIQPLFLYASAEALVAIGALAVPKLFDWSEKLLLRAGASSSAAFILLSAACIIGALLPWCVAMGATIPFMMTFVRRFDTRHGESFSLLYAANVLGAAIGALATAYILIELLGLHGTLTFAARGNIAIAAIAAALALFVPMKAPSDDVGPTGKRATRAVSPGWPGAVLFITGFSSVGMEVCWARDFTFVLKTTIYAFASILAVYLIATFIGSLIYRIKVSQDPAFSIESILPWLFALSLLPVLLCDPRTDHSIAQTLVSILPLCGVLGFLTPGLIDRFGEGDATRAGRLYALNIIGAIAGPLVAGYALLPLLGIRWAMIALAIPLLATLMIIRSGDPGRRAFALTASVLAAAVAMFSSKAYDDGSLYPRPSEVRRDYAASVVAYGTGTRKGLDVNAIPITSMTMDTKVMAHLPMALHGHARNALDICFGMGTTFRSLSTWGVRTTAVDLSPAVIESFGFFYSDASAILANPNNRVVADDGRRYLMRTNQRFDVITIDPPPPAEASGSSLLYSVQFYEVAKRRLKRGGILAQWVPSTEKKLTGSIALALARSFKHVLAFKGSSTYGVQFIASEKPLTVPSAEELIARMPPAARKDLVEWEHGRSPRAEMQAILNDQIAFAPLLPPPGSHVPALSDDRPYNEYYYLRRRTFAGLRLAQ